MMTVTMTVMKEKGGNADRAMFPVVSGAATEFPMPSIKYDSPIS